MRRTRDKIMVGCDLCGRQFEFGVEGRHIGVWDVTVCRSCGSSPHGEVTPIRHKKLKEILDAKGISYSLSDQGWIRWPLA